MKASGKTIACVVILALLGIFAGWLLQHREPPEPSAVFIEAKEVPVEKREVSAVPDEPASIPKTKEKSPPLTPDEMMDQALAGLLRGDDPAEALKPLRLEMASKGFHQRWTFWSRFLSKLADSGSLRDRFPLLCHMMPVLDEIDAEATSLSGTPLFLQASGRFLNNILKQRHEMKSGHFLEDLQALQEFINSQKQQPTPGGIPEFQWTRYLARWEGELKNTVFWNDGTAFEERGGPEHIQKGRETAQALAPEAREAFETGFLTTLAAINKSAAIDYLFHESKISRLQEQFVASILLDDFQKDATTVSMIIRDAPESSARDMAAAFITRRLAKSDPEAASAWHKVIRNVELREEYAKYLR